MALTSIVHCGLILFLFCQFTDTYKPVILIHGLNNSGKDVEHLEKIIKKHHPETNVTILRIYNGVQSFRNLWDQIKDVKKHVEKICRENPNGVHIVGHSMGAVVGRAVVQMLDNHVVENLVSLVGPHSGAYTGDNQPKTTQIPAKIMYLFFYNKFGQTIAFGNIWKDPNHMDLYYKKVDVLPIINNEIHHHESKRFKKNFLKIKKFVMIGTSDDYMVGPLETVHFGFVDKNGNKIKMEEQETYINDTIGLKTLNERGDVKRIMGSGATHMQTIQKPEFMEKYVIPWLT